MPTTPSSSSRTINACSILSCQILCTCCLMAGSSAPAARNWRWNWKRRATTGLLNTDCNPPDGRQGQLSRPCGPPLHAKMKMISMIETKPDPVTKQTDPHQEKFEQLIGPSVGKHP